VRAVAAVSVTPLASGEPEASARLGEPGQPEVVAFRPGPELAAYLDEGPEQDWFLSGADEIAEDQHSSAKHARANRISRVHPMPRLSRPRRVGVAPERDLAAAALPQAPGRKPDGAERNGLPDGAERKGLAAMAADAIGWASGELPGKAVAKDTAV
jgi:hypothetical protein